MEDIRQAVERAKEQRVDSGISRALRPGDTIASSRTANRFSFPIREIALDARYLQTHRIIAHGATNPLSRPYDMLRTQIAQAMEEKGSKILAVTSPTTQCGKTVTATNLALAAARQLDKSILLVDLDLHKPKIATYLGVPSTPGAIEVLEGHAPLHEAIIEGRIGMQRLLVLPTTSRLGASDIVASRAIVSFFQDLRREFSNSTIIVDLPPILSSDDVITVLPNVDCAVLVTAVGVTKVADIEECGKHLRTTEVIRIIVNKTTEPTSGYYYY
jgi:protein-tyrosine kinase